MQELQIRPFRVGNTNAFMKTIQAYLLQIISLCKIYKDFHFEQVISLRELHYINIASESECKVYKA